MTATYRGTAVSYVEHRRSDDVYVLRGADDTVLAELQAHEFLSQPQLRQVPHGRYRKTRPQIHLRTPEQSGDAHARALAKAGFAIGPVTTITFKNFTLTLTDPEPERPIEHAGIRAGEVTAVRAWRVIGDRLYSVYMADVEWFPDRPISGDVDVGMGIFAFKKDDHNLKLYLAGRLLVHMSAWATDDFGPAELQPIIFAIGTVHLWGEIVEHERGYRAQFGKIASLDRISGGDASILQTLHARYGVGQQQQQGAA